MSDAITYDVVADLESSLCTGWNTCNAAKPRFDVIWCEKSVGLAGSTQNTVLIQPLKEQIVSFQLHGDSWKHELPVKVDIRTYGTGSAGITAHNNIVKETGRILKNILRRAGATPVPFIDAHLRGGESLDEKYRNFFRFVYTIVYRDMTPFTFT